MIISNIHVNFTAHCLLLKCSFLQLFVLTEAVLMLMSVLAKSFKVQSLQSLITFSASSSQIFKISDSSKKSHKRANKQIIIVQQVWHDTFQQSTAVFTISMQSLLQWQLKWQHTVTFKNSELPASVFKTDRKNKQSVFKMTESATFLITAHHSVSLMLITVFTFKQLVSATLLSLHT